MPVALLALVGAPSQAFQQKPKQSPFMEGLFQKLEWADQAFKAGKHAEAAKAFQEAQPLTTQNIRTTYCYALSLFKIGDQVGANQYFNEVLKEASWDRAKWIAGVKDRDRYVIKAQSHFFIGQIHGHQKRWDLALSEYEEARRGGVFDADFNAGIIQFEQKKDYQAAIRLFQRESETRRDGNIKAINDNLGLCYYRLGREQATAGSVQEAIQSFKNALHFRPGWEPAQKDLDALTRPVAAAPPAVPSAPPPPPSPTLPAPLLAQWFQAIAQGKQGPVAKLLKREPLLVKATDKAGRTALHLVKSSDLTNLLMNAGADKEARAADGTTPLHHAVRQQDARMVDALLSEGRGVDILAKDMQGQTPLHWAAASNKSSSGLLKFLLLLGRVDGRVDVRDNQGRTPLMIAAMKGDLEAADQLLAEGADLRLVDAESHSALDLAIGSDQQEAAAHFRALNPLGPPPREVIFTACTFGWESSVEKLLEIAPALAESRDPKTKLPLIHLAIMRGLGRTVEKLIQLKVTLDHPAGELGYTPLIQAVKHGRLFAVRLLLAAGANPNFASMGGNGTTPLIEAMNPSNSVKQQGAIGSGPLTSALLEAGADPNKADALGGTALHVAPDLATASLLLDKGANPNAQDQDGFTPLRSQVEKGRDIKVLALLIERGARMDLADKKGYLPVHVAYHGSRLQPLIDHGADVNALGPEGSPLHKAVSGWNGALMKFLLAHGAKVNLPNKEGLTPLDQAMAQVKLSRDASERIIKILLEHGAKSGRDL